MSVRDATMPLSTLIHPMSIASISLHAVFTGLSPFWLVPVSTVPGVEGLHHQKHIAAGVTPCRSRVAHITYIQQKYVLHCLLLRAHSVFVS